ncbi:hypothetical protein [Streptomyces sp. L2]|uniref:glycan biosynthesis hexose transferase WsfD n=1 Tax=Streptomyces sp. L2 TaxID=2162665 RepID=UPI001012623E|nr:hypothetical protein [Streptomyces sp. L2]
MTTTTYDARAALERASARLRSSVREPSRRGVRTAAIVAGFVWTVVMLLRLLLGGVVGMGDDGDGTRLLCEFGVVSNHPWSAEPSAHVYPTYVSHTWYGETCGALFSGEPYYSSQQLVVGLAKALTPVLGLPGALDLRAIGLLLALAFGAIIALLVVLLPGPLWLRLVVTGCFGLVMCDSAFADFFISPYSEAAGFIGLLLLCPSLLLLWRRTTASVGGIVLTTAAALFTMTAKPQLLSLLPVTLLALLWRPSVRQKGERHSVSPGASRQQRFTRWLAVRWPALIACVLVCGVAGGFAAAQSKRLNQLVWYDAVFTEMLPNSMDPLADLQALGADQRLISAMNTTMISGRSAARTPFWDDYKQHVSPARIELHYLENPSRVVAMGSRGVQGMSRLTLHHLGSYPANSGHPQYAKERRIAVVTDIFEWLRDVPALIPLLWLVTIALGAVLASRPWARQPARALGRMTVCVVIALVLQFWTVVMTGGASDLHKHLVFTDFLTALCLPLAALCFVLLFRRAYAAAPEQVQNNG